MEQIKTERLLIRRFRPEDSAEMFSYLSDLKAIRFESYGPYSFAQAQAEAERRARDEGCWAVCLAGGRLIGEVSLSKGDFGNWQLHIILNRKYWDKGYGIESAGAVTNYAFSKQFMRRLVATCCPENERAWRLFEKLGMRREATHIQNVCFRMDENGRPVFQDTYEYALLKEEWSWPKRLTVAPGETQAEIPVAGAAPVESPKEAEKQDDLPAPSPNEGLAAAVGPSKAPRKKKTAAKKQVPGEE